MFRNSFITKQTKTKTYQFILKTITFLKETFLNKTKCAKLSQFISAKQVYK